MVTFVYVCMYTLLNNSDTVVVHIYVYQYSSVILDVVSDPLRSTSQTILPSKCKMV